CVERAASGVDGVRAVQSGGWREHARPPGAERAVARSGRSCGVLLQRPEGCVIGWVDDADAVIAPTIAAAARAIGNEAGFALLEYGIGLHRVGWVACLPVRKLCGRILARAESRVCDQRVAFLVHRDRRICVGVGVGRIVDAPALDQRWAGGIDLEPLSGSAL